MTIEELKQFTEDYFDVSLEPVDRKAHNVRARFIFYKTAYSMYPSKTLQEIGNVLGQNHATVLHGIREVSNIIKFDKRYAEGVEGYNQVIQKTLKDKNFEYEDYDGIKESRKIALQLSAEQKISAQKRTIKAQRKTIRSLTAEIGRLKHKIDFYHEMTGY